MKITDILDIIVKICLIAVCVVMLCMEIFAIKSDNLCTIVPDGYHIIHDESNKALVVPEEYHFKSDDKGVLYLVK